MFGRGIGLSFAEIASTVVEKWRSNTRQQQANQSVDLRRAARGGVFMCNQEPSGRASGETSGCDRRASCHDEPLGSVRCQYGLMHAHILSPPCTCAHTGVFCRLKRSLEALTMEASASKGISRRYAKGHRSHSGILQSVSAERRTTKATVMSSLSLITCALVSAPFRLLYYCSTSSQHPNSRLLHLDQWYVDMLLQHLDNVGRQNG